MWFFRSSAAVNDGRIPTKRAWQCPRHGCEVSLKSTRKHRRYGSVKLGVSMTLKWPSNLTSVPVNRFQPEKRQNTRGSKPKKATCPKRPANLFSGPQKPRTYKISISRPMSLLHRNNPLSCHTLKQILFLAVSVNLKIASYQITSYFYQSQDLCPCFPGRYVGSRPIKLRKSTWKNRNIDIVRKKDKEKAALINMLTGSGRWEK